MTKENARKRDYHVRSAKSSITKLGPNHYRVRVEGPKDPRTGKRNQLSKTIRGSRKQAEETKRRMEIEAGADVVDSDMPFGEYVESVYWPDREHQMKRRSVSGYKSRLRLYILPYFGDMPLKEITVQRVKMWLAEFEKPTLALEAYKVLKAILSHAVFELYLNSNPCMKVHAPKVPAYVPDTIGADDVFRYMEQYRGSSIEPAVLIAIGAGLRRGEICALDAEDIDWRTGELTIDDAYLSDGGEAFSDTTKSPSGVRKVHVPKTILARLREVSPGSGPLMPGKDGRMHPDAVKRAYERVQSRDTWPDDLPKVTLKNLRHSSLSLAYDAGADMLALQDRGGHANISTTKRYYLKPRGDRDAAIADAMDSKLNADKSPMISFRVMAGSVESF